MAHNPEPLPAPPAGRRGWPWTDLPAATREAGLPVISVITPSFQHGAFIEETIRSVLGQGYPSVELIVIDGGSTDETVSILRKYDHLIAHWVSERDRGQAHAINKGFALATGSVFAWLNSDDFLLPGALSRVGEAFAARPEAVVVGAGREVDGGGRVTQIRPPGALDRESLLRWERWFVQAACFFPADAFRAVGGLDEALHFAMDLDLWLKLARTAEFMPVSQELACWRRHEGAKTVSQAGKMYAETRLVQQRYGGDALLLELLASDHMKHKALQRRWIQLVGTPPFPVLRAARDRLRGLLRRGSGRVS